MLSNVAYNNDMLPFYVIDDYTFYNPHPHEKVNSREIDSATKTTWYDRQQKLITHMVNNPDYWRIGEFIRVGDKTMKRESLDDFRKIYNLKTKMKIYCITPVYDPNIKFLEKNIESVRNQTVDVTHILVFDGNKGLDKVKEYAINLNDIEIINLPKAHRDYGDTPRFIGSVSAFQRGADAVFWLDDDNWIEPNHAEKMSANLTQSRPIATCQRNICTLDGELMGICFEIDPKEFIDTNCFMIHRSSKSLCSIWWMIQDDQHIFGDKILYKHILENKILTTHYQKPTVNYRTNFNFHYQHYGYPIPETAKDGVGVQYANREK